MRAWLSDLGTGASGGARPSVSCARCIVPQWDLTGIYIGSNIRWQLATTFAASSTDGANAQQRQTDKRRGPQRRTPTASATGRQDMADSAFYDLAETPEEAANLTARGMLMIAIEQRVREEGWTQTEGAARLHVNPPRGSGLLNGEI